MNEIQKGVVLIVTYIIIILISVWYAKRINDNEKDIIAITKESVASFASGKVANKNGIVATTDTLDQFIADQREWKFLHVQNRVAISERSEEISTFKAFRGEVITDVPLDEIIHAFLNASLTVRWADKMKSIDIFELPINYTYFSSSSSNVKSEAVPAKDLEPASKKKKKFNFMFWKKDKSKIDPNEIISNNVKDSSKSSKVFNEWAIFDLLLNTAINTAEDVVYQVYTMFPLPPRDFLFRRGVVVRDGEKLFVSQYRTFHAPEVMPVLKNTLRTTAPYTTWRFQRADKYCDTVLDSGSSNHRREMQTRLCTEYNKDTAAMRSKYMGMTYISLESLVLLEDIGLSWLVNYIQRSWPTNTLTAFIRETKLLFNKHRDVQRHARFAQWLL